MRILLIGNGAREHAIAWKLKQNPDVELYNVASANNPGLIELCKEIYKDTGDFGFEYAKKIKPDLVWVGPELPLQAGIVNKLHKLEIKCVGPTSELARLETSKTFTRELLVKNNIDACPAFKSFNSEVGLEDFVQSLDKFVVKPDGLTGGKGVRVQDDHFSNPEEGTEYAKECILSDGRVLIEEKLIGQEFSLMSYADGKNLAHMMAVQDHKRAYENDEGPNTGGMGTYSDSNHSMPFLQEGDIEKAQEINAQVLKALGDYRGILYGNFIATKTGLKIIEYNARLGDPEAMNVLYNLETDLVEISEAIVKQTLDKIDIKFGNLATVCKYVVPEGYPDNPVKDKEIDVSEVDQNKVQLFYASIDSRDDKLFLGGSRAIGVIAKAPSIYEAEKQVEEEIVKIKGPVFHRKDIGTKQLIEKRINSQKEIMS